MKINDLPFAALNEIGAYACNDAKQHGLWEDIDKYQPWNREWHCAAWIQDETEEAMLVVGHDEYREELADVVIMALSSAAYLGIDIAAEVCRKMKINAGRPWKHGKGGAERGKAD